MLLWVKIASLQCRDGTLPGFRFFIAIPQSASPENSAPVPVAPGQSPSHRNHGPPESVPTYEPGPRGNGSPVNTASPRRLSITVAASGDSRPPAKTELAPGPGPVVERVDGSHLGRAGVAGTRVVVGHGNQIFHLGSSPVFGARGRPAHPYYEEVCPNSTRPLGFFSITGTFPNYAPARETARPFGGTKWRARRPGVEGDVERIATNLARSYVPPGQRFVHVGNPEVETPQPRSRLNEPSVTSAPPPTSGRAPRGSPAAARHDVLRCEIALRAVQSNIIVVMDYRIILLGLAPPDSTAQQEERSANRYKTTAQGRRSRGKRLSGLHRRAESG